MRDDDQVKAALSIKKDMVVNTGWTIKCEDDVPPEVKEYLTESLKRINGGPEGAGSSFEDVLRDILSAYDYGFSLSEPVYEFDDGEGLWCYKEIRTRPPHSFTFDIDEKGNIKAIKQLALSNEQPYEPKTFIHHVYQMEFGNPYGKSDLRAAFTPWKAKKFVMKFYNIYLEKYASPGVIGRYKPNMAKEDVAEFFEMLKNWQQNTAMTIPEDVLIEFAESQKDSSGSYQEALHVYDMKIARAILVPDLLGLSGGATKGGSLALGKEHFKTFLGVIRKDRESLQAKITNRLIKPLAAINWGDDIAEKVCFEFIPFSDDSIVEMTRLWIDAVKANVWKPSDEEVNHLRAVAGFPEGEVERPEPVVQQLDANGNPMPPKPGMAGSAPKKPGQPAAGAVDKTAQPAKGADDAKAQKNAEYARAAKRRLTIYEKKMDFDAIHKAMEDSEARALPALKRVASVIWNDLITQVRDKGILRKFKPESINSIQPRFVRDMNMVFKNHFKDLFNAAAKTAKAEIYREQKNHAADDEGDGDTLLPEQFLQILNAESFKAVGDYSTDITKKARNIIVQGIKDGVPESEIVSLLRDELGATTDKWLATVVRTKTTEIYNDARKSYWDNDEFAKQVIEAYEFSAILDDRTTDVCRFLDGKIFDKSEFLNKITPPLHFNCRSILVPVTRFEAYQDDENYVEPGTEPSFEKLKDMGGNLIVGSD